MVLQAAMRSSSSSSTAATAHVASGPFIGVSERTMSGVEHSRLGEAISVVFWISADWLYPPDR